LTGAARMRSDQAEIERLKADSKALQTETLALLAALKSAAWHTPK
jgi:hypothetical protein